MAVGDWRFGIGGAAVQRCRRRSLAHPVPLGSWRHRGGSTRRRLLERSGSTGTGSRSTGTLRPRRVARWARFWTSTSPFRDGSVAATSVTSSSPLGGLSSSAPELVASSRRRPGDGARQPGSSRWVASGDGRGPRIPLGAALVPTGDAAAGAHSGSGGPSHRGRRPLCSQYVTKEGWVAPKAPRLRRSGWQPLRSSASSG